MNVYEDSIVLLDDKNRITAELGVINFSVHREYIYGDTKFLHYLGNINSFKEVMPDSLSKLLIEKAEAVNNGIFSVIDDLNNQINRFRLKLKKYDLRVYDLYIEDENIDFAIPKSVAYQLR